MSGPRQDYRRVTAEQRCRHCAARAVALWLVPRRGHVALCERHAAMYADERGAGGAGYPRKPCAGCYPRARARPFHRTGEAVSDTDVKIIADTATPFLERAAKKAGTLEHVKEPLTRAVRDIFHKRFDTLGAYGSGTRWPDLNAHTVKKLDQETMRDRGTLYGSLVAGSEFGFSKLGGGGRQLAVGSEDPSLRFTELGTRRMPARPVLPDEIPQADVDRLADIIADSLLRDD